MRHPARFEQLHLQPRAFDFLSPLLVIKSEDPRHYTAVNSLLSPFSPADPTFNQIPSLSLSVFERKTAAAASTGTPEVGPSHPNEPGNRYETFVPPAVLFPALFLCHFTENNIYDYMINMFIENVVFQNK